MDKVTSSVKFLFLCFLTVISVIFCGCRQAEPVNHTSYDAVTSKLDPRGSYYLYADTQQLMDYLVKHKGEAANLVKSIFHDRQAQELAEQIANLGINVFINSGLPQMDGIGVSSIRLNQDLFRCKFIAHKKPAPHPDALIWNVFGKSPHELKSLEMLPADTAFASFFDFDAVAAGRFISQELRNAKIEDILVAKNQFAAAFAKATGMSPLALCEKLGGRFGIFLTLSKDKTFMLPVDNQYEKLPEITFNFVISVKDDTLFDLISKKLPGKLNPRETTENGIRMVVTDPIPLMLKFQPAIGQKNGLLVMSSQPEAVRAFFNPDAKDKLIATSEFKKLAENIPIHGNGYKYVSPEICQMMFKVQSFFSAMQKLNQSDSKFAPPPEYHAQIAQLYGNMKNFSIYQCNPDGIYIEANSNVNLPGLVTLNAMLAPFIYTATTIQATQAPKASDPQKEAQCLNNLKQIGLGIMMYISDNDERFPVPGVKGLEELRDIGYLRDSQIFICPVTNDTPAAKGRRLSSKNVSYIYLGPYAPMREIRNPSRTPLAFDRPGNHQDFVNVLFVDGHASRVKGNFKTCSDVIRAVSDDLPENVRNRLLDMASQFDKKTQRNN